jgi:hypothetical protein
MLLKTLVIIIVLTGSMLALWRGWIGFLVPVAGLGVYAFLSGFHQINMALLMIFAGLTAVVQLAGWMLARRYRDGNLAFTGAGITGMATGLLLSMMLGTFLGFFVWWDMIGQVTLKPLGLGIGPILKSFAGGAVKFIYAIIITGVVSVWLF